MNLIEKNMIMEPYVNISKVHFWGIDPKIDIRKVMSTKVAQNSCNPAGFRNSLGNIYLYFYESLWRNKRFVFNKSSQSNFLLFYGMFNCRKDHQRTFLNFAKHYEDADVCYADFYAKKRITLLHFLLSIFLFPIWSFQMIFKRVPIYEIFNAIRYVNLTYIYTRELRSVVNTDYKFIVVYYDTSPDENYLVQVFKNRGIITMTMQHGIFARKSHIKSISDTAFELQMSISDYFLAWNTYTQDEAVKVGLEKNRVVVLGAPKFIDAKKPNEVLCCSKNIFGVILNNSAFDFHNKKLVEMANIISESVGYKYVLRYHPQLKGNEYNSLTNSFYGGSSSNDKTIAEYASEVSFTIISSSSVFVDLLMLNHPVYRLRVHDEDTYSTVLYNSFQSVGELKAMLDNCSDNSEVFNYLCNDYNVYQNYRNFFNKYLK